MRQGKWIWAMLLALLCVVSAGCSPNSQGQPGGGDRDGTQVETIGSLGPANTEILVGLGLGDQIIIADTYSSDVEGLNPQVLYTDMMMPDVEQIVQAAPDVLFVTGMTLTGGDDPYKPVLDAGIWVVYMPSTGSVAGILEDIRTLAQITGTEVQGEEMVAQMEGELARIQAIADTIPDEARRTVYFEVTPAPHIISFGSDVFLDELIQMVGASNVLAEHSGYISINDEAVLAANPDVILTSVDYIGDPVGDVLNRAGWDVMSAVQNGAVYRVDTNSTNRASQNIVRALDQMARLVYPEYYEN